MDMLDQVHGVTVYSLDGGVTFKSDESPYVGDLASVDPTTSAVTGPSANAAEGVTYFLGGHVYTVSDAVAAALIDSGYEAYVTPGGLYPNTSLFPNLPVYPAGVI